MGWSSYILWLDFYPQGRCHPCEKVSRCVRSTLNSAGFCQLSRFPLGKSPGDNLVVFFLRVILKAASAKSACSCQRMGRRRLALAKISQCRIPAKFRSDQPVNIPRKAFWLSWSWYCSRFLRAVDVHSVSTTCGGTFFTHTNTTHFHSAHQASTFLTTPVMCSGILLH